MARGSPRPRSAIPGVAIALIAGPFSDRYGRKRFLVGGATVLGERRPRFRQLFAQAVFTSMDQVRTSVVGARIVMHFVGGADGERSAAAS
ncbi:MAG TPA: hypothetical protein VF998_04125 [Candidatus Limnocylindria bacterium]